jgi:hypothetical protein
MTESKTPFDHRPDPILGSALREALAPGASVDFVARVIAAAQGRRTRHSVEHYLARWARRGIAVAAVAALFAGFFIGRTPQTMEQTVADADQGAMIGVGQAAEPSMLFAANPGH